MNSCDVDEKTSRTATPHKHKSVVARGQRWGERLTTEGHRGTWGDGTVLCFNSVAGYAICQNSKKCTPKAVHLTESKLQFNWKKVAEEECLQKRGARGNHVTKYGCAVSVQSRFSCVWLFATLWTVACQASLSTGFSRLEYWSGLPCSPGDIPDPGIEPVSLVYPTSAGGFFTTSATFSTSHILASANNLWILLLSGFIFYFQTVLLWGRLLGILRG